MDLNGNISGTPTKAGTYSILVFITDSNSGMVAAQPAFSLTVSPAPTFSTTSPLPTGLVGTPYSQKIAISGGVPPFTFGVSGARPPGLILDSSGLLSGTPTTAGTYTFALTATDSLGISTPPTSFSITITSSTPMLQVTPTSLTFTALTGGDAPPPQALSITLGSGATSGAFRVVLDGGTSGTAAPSWLSVTPTSGTAPAQVIVSADQGTLQTGGSGRIQILDANGLANNVTVTLNLTSLSPAISVVPSMLRFAARTQTPGTLVQDLALTSTGGGGPLGFTTSVVNGSSWLSVGPPSSGQTTRNVPVLLPVNVNTQGLAVGSYHDSIQISASGLTVKVPVELFVSSGGSILGVNVTGLRFPALQGAGPANAKSIKVLNLGDPSSTVNWTATLLSGSNWLTLSPSSGTATLSAPGVLTLTPNQASGSLTTAQYALIQITDPHSQVSPQYVVAVLDIQPSTASPVPDLVPAGLFFTAVAGGSATTGQTVSVQTSSSTNVAFQAAASTTDGGTWLTVSPASGNASTATPGSVTVSVNPSKLTAGIYTGGVSVSIAGIVRTVNITAVVQAGSGTGSVFQTEAVPAAAGCSPSKLALTETGLVNNFSVPAAWPANLIAQLNDDCGSAVSSGSVVASFSNGDAPITLRSDSTGNYSATWQPGIASQQMVITLNAASGSLAPATAKLVGGITQNSAPTLATGGTLNNLNPIVGGALAPGTVSQVYGTGLSPTFTGNPGVLPLPNAYPPTGSTFMLAGGLSAPLYYLSSGQLNVQLPNELAPNQQYAVIVSSNNALTLPDIIDVVPAQPGVAATGDGHVIAQHIDYSLVNSSSPAHPGEYITIYLVGMGATSPSVPTGAPAPSTEPLARVTVQPTVTVGGISAPPGDIYYAGLSGGFAGLYQITFKVPAGANTGDSSLVVSQGGVNANVTLLTISQ